MNQRSGRDSIDRLVDDACSWASIDSRARAVFEHRVRLAIEIFRELVARYADDGGNARDELRIGDRIGVLARSLHRFLASPNSASLTSTRQAIRSARELSRLLDAPKPLPGAKTGRQALARYEAVRVLRWLRRGDEMVIANQSGSQYGDRSRPLLKRFDWIRGVARQVQRLETRLRSRLSVTKQSAEILGAKLAELAEIAARSTGRHDEGFGRPRKRGRRLGMRAFQQELAACCAHALSEAGVAPILWGPNLSEQTKYTQLVREALVVAEIRDRKGNMMVFDFTKIAALGFAEYRRAQTAAR